MTWVEWINNLSKYKYGVHLMPTWAAGTFTLNCAYQGIPCIGYKGLDTQEKLHPNLSVDMGDLKRAKQLANWLKTDKEFYDDCSEICKNLYTNSDFRENRWLNIMENTLGEILNETD